MIISLFHELDSAVGQAKAYLIYTATFRINFWGRMLYYKFLHKFVILIELKTNLGLVNTQDLCETAIKIYKIISVIII